MAAAPAFKVYVCNVATQKGETDSFTVADNWRALKEHVGDGIFDCVLANSNIEWANGHSYQPVSLGNADLGEVRLVMADVVSDTNHYHHDSHKLAAALLRIFYDRSSWTSTFPTVKAEASIVTKS